MFLFLLRKVKGLTLRLNVHVVLGPFEKFFEKLVLTSKLSKWRNKIGTIEFNDFYTSKFDYDKRLKLFEYILKKEKLEDEQELVYIEFGVAEGNSFMWWLKALPNPNTKFYGFDTFTGLPEDWGHFKKGDMASPNGIPKTEDKRAIFYQGLFQKTIPDFLNVTNIKTKRKIVHMDADLYSSTLYVLTMIRPYLNSGDILFFDEFNVPLHEFKAFTEFVDSFYIEYEVLGAVNNYYQISVKIK